MGAKLYLGNGQATPSIVVEKPVPMPLSIQYRKDANGKILKPNTIIDIDGATDIGNYGLYYAFINCAYNGNVDFSSLKNITGNYGINNAFQYSAISSIDLSSLESISGIQPGDFAFYGCSNLTTVNLHNLKTISGTCKDMFYKCTSLTNVDLSSLTTLSDRYTGYYFFEGCSKLEIVDLSKLTNIGFGCFDSAFKDCTKLINVNLDSLSNMGNNALQECFKNCKALKTLSFPALTSNSFGNYTNQFYKMLNGCTDVTIHFPSNLESTISTLQTYPDFSGTNTILLYDLPATE